MQVKYLSPRTTRILEYLSREDAERAVKDLDGKDLRGRPVRVALDDSVSPRVIPRVCLKT